MTAERSRTTRRWEVRGTVQGVGFRPFVYRLGRSLGLDGWVRNDGGVVVVEACGRADALAEFTDRVRADAPPRVIVSAVSFVDLWKRIDRLACPLVCTSGNRTEEPIAIDDEAAAERLGDIAARIPEP